MPKPNKQHIIDNLIKQIGAGNERGKVLATDGKKWQLSQRTFDRYWKIANQQHAEAHSKIKEELAKDNTLKELEAQKQALMTSTEKKELLVRRIKHIEATIDKGKTLDYVKTYKGFINSKKERYLNALEIASLSETLQKLTAELNKMEGDYAPIKSKIDIPQFNNMKFGYGDFYSIYSHVKLFFFQLYFILFWLAKGLQKTF